MGNGVHGRSPGVGILAWVDIVSGLALALILQTGMRSSSLGIGLGEIVLAACTATGLVMTGITWKRTKSIMPGGMRHWGILLILGYLFVGLLPLTLYSALTDFPGSSPRDWIAYLYSALFLLSIAFRPTHFRRMSASLAVGLILFWGASLLFGSEEVWYYGRFRGVALNPNQVALYALCGLTLFLAYLRHVPLIAAAFLGLAVIGYLAKSDALTIAILVCVLSTGFAALVPRTRLRVRLPWIVVVGALLWLLFRDDLHERLTALWAAADYQNARYSLYAFAIDAWLSSARSFLLGFGAGSYSGMTGPFQGSEAHNTVLDALTIGGFPMLCAVYLFPVSALVLAYRQGRILLFGALSSLIVFSFFHYVARHPIYWLAGYGVFVYLVSSGAVIKKSTPRALQPREGAGMKILFISYFFPPYNAIGAVRTGKMVKRMLEAGHDVRVVSASRQGLPPTLERDVPDGVVSYTDWVDVDMFVARAVGSGTVSRIKSSGAAPRSKSGMLARLLGMASRLYISWMHVPDRYIGWHPFARRACKQLIDEGWRPDVIYASATPYTALMVASGIGKQYGIPWVGELRDLWTDNPYAHHRALSKWLERRTLRTASALVTVSEPLADLLRRKYDSPCHVVMNGFDAEDFAAVNAGADRREVVERRFRIVYTGQLYAGRRDPTMLFQALAQSPELRSRVCIDFYGQNLGWVVESAHEYGLQGVVRVHEPVSRRDAIGMQMQADLLLLLTWNDPRERGVLTGKLFEYIGARRPILVLGHIDGDAADLVSREGFGVASNDPAEIAGFIAALVSDPAIASNYRLAFHARADAYERKRQVDQLIRVFHGVRTHSSKNAV